MRGVNTLRSAIKAQRSLKRRTDIRWVSGEMGEAHRSEPIHRAYLGLRVRFDLLGRGSSMTFIEPSPIVVLMLC
jgi:hypothetical protein